MSTSLRIPLCNHTYTYSNPAPARQVISPLRPCISVFPRCMAQRIQNYSSIYSTAAWLFTVWACSTGGTDSIVRAALPVAQPASHHCSPAQPPIALREASGPATGRLQATMCTCSLVLPHGLWHSRPRVYGPLPPPSHLLPPRTHHPTSPSLVPITSPAHSPRHMFAQPLPSYIPPHPPLSESRYLTIVSSVPRQVACG